MEVNEAFNLEQTEKTSQTYKYLIISAKGKFKWKGDFQGLQNLINQLLGLQTEWSKPGGDAKKFENDKIAIRCYPNTSSLTIKGADSSKLQDKLVLIANEEPEMPESNFEHETLVDEEIKHGDEEGVEAAKLLTSEDPGDVTQDEAGVSGEILKYLQQLENKMETKFEALTNDMRTLRATTELIGEIRTARTLNETLKLEEENYALKEKVNNQSYLISELTAKAKDLENERSSLLTVVRILQAEAHNASQEWKTVEPRRQKQIDKSHTGRATTVKEGKYQAMNRFEILSDTTDSEVNETEDYYERNNENRRMTVKHRYGKSSIASTSNKHEQFNQKQNEQNKGRKSQSTTAIIVGDSIIKHLDKRRLQRSISKPHKVRTETYSGANIAAMKHHIKPCLESQPDKVILHVGTNDVDNKEATEIVEGIAEIGQLIKQASGKTEIIISQIVNRTDKTGITKKINEVNKKLADYCKLNKWGLIRHDNITSKHLNSYGYILRGLGLQCSQKILLPF